MVVSTAEGWVARKAAKMVVRSDLMMVGPKVERWADKLDLWRAAETAANLVTRRVVHWECWWVELTAEKKADR